MCKLCDMMRHPDEEDTDIKYAESDNWVCVGNEETGNPYVIYKDHYSDTMTKEIREEGKMMINLLTTKYWKKMELNIEGKSYPHVHLIISEVR